MSDHPRLSVDAMILPYGPGWMVKVGHDVSVVASRVTPSKRDRFLDLLDGCHDETSIATLLKLPRREVTHVLSELARLGLLEHGAPRPEETEAPPPQLARAGGDRTATQVARRILLCGLGELGVAVLHELLATGGVEAHLFDPTLVEREDLGGVYRRSDLGRDKLDVVSERLTAGSRRRVGRARFPELLSRGTREDAVASALESFQVVVCCSDRPSHLPVVLARACRAADTPLIAVEAGEREGRLGPVLVGPSSDPGTGCAICAARYRESRDPFTAALGRDLEARFPLPARWRHRLNGHARSTLAKLTVLAVWKALDVAEGGRCDASRLVTVGALSREVRATPVPKHYACPRCFPAVERSRARLRRETEQRWQATYRCEPKEPLDMEALWRRLRPVIGPEYGIFRPPHHGSGRDRDAVREFFTRRGVNPSGNAMAGAHTALAIRPGASGARALTVVTGALDFDSPRAAESLALAEGIERLFALDYCEARSVVRARYSAVRAEALDPRKAPLYAEAQYRDPDFPLRRFDPEETIPWVWGMCLPDHAPVLVPFDLVFASASRRSIYQPTSNGAACHSSFHHAVLNGIYETIERDALMVVWLNQFSLPRVDLGRSDPDPYAVRRTLEALSFDCAHVDLTTDLGIPVMLAVLTDRLDPDFYLLDMVAALDAGAQLGKLYRELVQFLHPHLVDSTFYRKAISEADDVNQVVSFADHLRFYQHRDKIRRAAFLTSSPRAGTFGDGPYAPRTLGIRQELDVLVRQLFSRGHEVIIVNCTAPLLDALGLCAVKVLIPGLQPLTAGHRLRALGGARILRVARQLGLAERDRTLAELNPWPHPFW